MNSKRPNIIIMLADDLGYGDVKCCNPHSKIDTPHMDKMAAEGMLFTDAHTSSAVCTPSRYALLTGRYCWRTPMKAGVLFGYDPDLVEPERITLPKLLKQAGYYTGCIGKWHLGMTLPTTDGVPANQNEGNTIDWEAEIKGGPIGAGFDYYFGISASLDMPPYVYIRNNRFTDVPIAKRERDLRPYYRNRDGWIASGFKDENVLPDITAEAVHFIEERSGTGEPFFLYFPVNSPHTPIVPVDEYKNSSDAGDYGDFVRQTDGVVGRIMESLERCGVAENTLFIVTSDNGAENVTLHLREDYGHHPSGHLKGMKRDLWDGGHRMPFITWWKGTVPEGSVCNKSICLTDVMATCAEITGAELLHDAGEDSFGFLKFLHNDVDNVEERAAIIHHSFNGSLAIRQGKWKYIDCTGSGGNSYDFPEWQQQDEYPGQLYDMEADVSEKHNLFGKHPEMVNELKELLEKIKEDGRSRP
jgi:arylsulfatase A